ncbi:PH domain-containing protein [Streptomyces sp. AF1A]|uniref:PH domain-containing protein n=1 Tax=Streptomyces sp. AF1A TaxID=3394350 RepID=UPI0039BCE23C
MFNLERLLRSHHLFSRWLGWGLLALQGCLLAWSLLRLRRGFTRVDTSGVTIRGAFLTRRIPWSEIYELDARKGPRAQKAGSFVGTVDGRRRTLPQLDVWQVEGVHRELTALREFGTRYGARTWERRPEVEQALRRRAGRAHSVGKAIVAAAVAWLAMFLLWLTLGAAGREPSAPLLLAGLPVVALVFFLAYFQWHWEAYVPSERDAW